MIPELEDGVLPEGIHMSTTEEIAQVFGVGDRRRNLVEKLRQFIQDARLAGFVSFIVVDGSFVTGKREPEDIDLVVALDPDFDLGGDQPCCRNGAPARSGCGLLVQVGLRDPEGPEPEHAGDEQQLQ